MAYEKQNFETGQVLEADHLNHMEAGIEDLDKNKLGSTELQGAINTALAQAKASGEFTGPKGDKGDTGSAGSNGTSVTVSSVNESTADGGSNVVTFSDGKTLTVKNGSRGSKGDKGDTGSAGSNGTSCTHSWSGTTLSVTSASGTSSANLKGDKGDTGPAGSNGKTPVKGTDYYTEADKTEMVNRVISALPTWTGGSY